MVYTQYLALVLRFVVKRSVEDLKVEDPALVGADHGVPLEPRQLAVVT